MTVGTKHDTLGCLLHNDIQLTVVANQYGDTIILVLLMMKVIATVWKGLSTVYTLITMCLYHGRPLGSLTAHHLFTMTRHTPVAFEFSLV